MALVKLAGIHAKSHGLLYSKVPAEWPCGCLQPGKHVQDTEGFSTCMCETFL